ncbi:MAG: hypothetical protein VR75_11635 [Hyphomonadaceae bacterium BRH_c29]|nr:MAG: hypothetical protein VR75_11635 [Hyphomonadaceae bacterium BRH_c29]
MSRSGTHLGWFDQDVIVNNDGYVACATADAMQSTKFEPFKSFKSFQEFAPYKPYVRREFGGLSCKMHLMSGAK